MRADFLLPPLLGVIALLAWPVSVASSLTYCSSVNTGSSQAANESTYQSNGLCEDHCSNYAFGILQGYDCWCSNIVPNEATNVNTSQCSQDCPGYPDDSCGSTSKGLYGYVEIVGHQPSGTATVSTTSTSSTSPSMAERFPYGPLPCTANESVDSVAINCAIAASVAETSSSSETTAATTTGESVAVTTDSGVVKTVTIPAATKATSTSAADNLSSAKSSDNSGMSSGTIAGVVVGSVGGALAILALIFVLFFAKRKSRSNSPDPSVQSILLDGRQSKGSQMSFMKGMFSDNHSHTLSAGSAASRLPTFTDNRMKTDTVLYANGRRDSDVSLQDNEDYSRPVLRLTNPD
ncbi:ER membrane protein [Aspergillus piperis CBS 112811]|uniref:ER membrane protein n=1 Tax=Aspergillus piperis CBS 112811 TaxID=1448313 RepID=A0A8G1RB39_9EURO|nr:ER membrane protein [Aspergillus piperis CBS 112811]RAH62923.1 ER membrane protein [Aspergillus piperis CBS 112811]